MTDKTLDEILDYLERTVSNMAKEVRKTTEFQEGFQEIENFLSSQFDIRLENILQAKHSSIHHLESGMKNKVIQKKQEILKNITRKA